MCGILGYYHLDHQPVGRSKDEVLALRDLMRNRGPDACGYAEGARRDWILAHRRLCILDLSERGNQPMSTPDGKIHVCYNGEIYNYLRLREDLARRGVSFVSTSDTEAILHLYRLYGTDCFKMLEGMFALIIIDEEKQRAIIARDPVGKKPLYYALIGRNLVVASDPGVISRDKHYRKAVSIDGVYSVLAMGGVSAPHSLFQDIHKLEPGSYRVVDAVFGIGPGHGFSTHPTKTDLIDSEDAVTRWTTCSTGPSRSA
jgi:asparagine synthase (glutamine-hydrolysing)